VYRAYLCDSNFCEAIKLSNSFFRLIALLTFEFMHESHLGNNKNQRCVVAQAVHLYISNDILNWQRSFRSCDDTCSSMKINVSLLSVI